jgi:cytochrome P450
MNGEDSHDKTWSHSTIFHQLAHTDDLPPEERTLLRLVDEGQSVVAAGQVTTTQYLFTTVYHVLANPEVLAKLRAELVEAMPDGSLAPLQRLEQLSYLAAVVSEGCRMSHGVTHRSQRVSPDTDLIFHDHVIPAGTPVGMTSIFMHENPEHFPEPRAFRPERWLNSGSRDRLEKHLVNFGKGTRSCLGRQLALAEIYLTMAAIFRRFDMELYETTREDIDVAHDFFTPHVRKGSKGLRVIVK